MGTPAAASGKGQSFLLLAGGPVGGQPAQPGGSRAPRSGSRELSPAERGQGEGALWVPSYLENTLGAVGGLAPGRVPEPRWPLPKGPASLLRGGSSLAPTPCPPSSSFPSSLTGSPRPPSPSDRLAAARPLGYPPLAAHSLQHGEPGPAPGEGAAGKLQPGPNPLLRDLREPGKESSSPARAPLRDGAKEASLHSALSGAARQAFAALAAATAPRSLARTGPLVGSAHSDRAWRAGSTVATSVPTSGREDPTSALQPRPQVERGL